MTKLIDTLNGMVKAHIDEARSGIGADEFASALTSLTTELSKEGTDLSKRSATAKYANDGNLSAYHTLVLKYARIMSQLVDHYISLVVDDSNHLSPKQYAAMKKEVLQYIEQHVHPKLFEEASAATQ